MGLVNDSISLVLDATGVSQAARDFRDLAATTAGLGTTPGVASFLTTIGAAGSARAAYERSMSGFGLVGNAQAGNMPQFNQIQAVDYGERYLKLLKHMADLMEKDDQRGTRDAQIFAERVGLMDQLWLQHAGPDRRRQLMDQMESNRNSPALKALEHATANTNSTWERMKAMSAEKIAGPMSMGERIKEGIANFLMWSMEHSGNYALKASSASHPVNQNTQALNSLNNSLRLYAGLYGGGNRARAAMGAFGNPFAFSVPSINQVWRSSTFKLGAYSIGM